MWSANSPHKMAARKRLRSSNKGQRDVVSKDLLETNESDSEAKTPAAKRKLEERTTDDAKSSKTGQKQPAEPVATTSKRITRSHTTRKSTRKGVEDELEPSCDDKVRKEGVDSCPSSEDVDERPISGRDKGSTLISGLSAVLYGRKDQILLLTSLLSEPGCPGHPLLYIYGNSGMGKSVVTRTVIDAMKISTAYVDCSEFFTTRSLLEHIMDELSGHTLSAENNYVNYEQVDNMAVFVRKLRELLRSDTFSGKTVCIILDNVQKLKSFEATVLPALTRLHELCHDNRLCVVLISYLTWERVRGDANCFHPIAVHFPNYSKEETIDILSRHCPQGSSVAFYRSYVSQLWSVVSHVCQDINELRHLAAMLYLKYREPVDNGEVSSKDTVKLWTRIQPTLKTLMGKIYLHETVVCAPTENTASVDTKQPTVSGSDGLELSHDGKYLLLAAYLASYNPASTDKRFFAKGKASHKRRGRPVGQTEKANRQLIGPKAFPLDRLMAIFHTITDHTVGPSVSLFSQVTSLVHLQFLGQVAMGESYLDTPKYKCLVTLDFVLGVARSVKCDLLSYLHDFT